MEFAMLSMRASVFVGCGILVRSVEGRGMEFAMLSMRASVFVGCG
jgi:hypothetical protein